jgi:hypothetical protein
MAKNAGIAKPLLCKADDIVIVKNEEVIFSNYVKINTFVRKER